MIEPETRQHLLQLVLTVEGTIDLLGHQVTDQFLGGAVPLLFCELEQQVSIFLLWRGFYLPNAIGGGAHDFIRDSPFNTRLGKYFSWIGICLSDLLARQ